MMKSDKSTFYAILLWGVVIYAIALLIYCTLRNYSADSKDFISDFGSIVGGIGTFFAAFVAAYLFNDWREEKNFDLENSLLTNILVDLKPIFVELHIIRTNSDNLKLIDTSFIIKTHYIERTRIDMYKSIITLYSNIKIYSDIKKNEQLIELYHTFEKYCLLVEEMHKELFLKRYRRYYERAIQAGQKNNQDPHKTYDILREYSSQRVDHLLIDIAEIKRFFRKNELNFIVEDKEKSQTTYDDLLNDCIVTHNKIQDYCTNQLNAFKLKKYQ
jgi:hypothetical protein